MTSEIRSNQNIPTSLVSNDASKSPVLTIEQKKEKYTEELDKLFIENFLLAKKMSAPLWTNKECTIFYVGSTPPSSAKENKGWIKIENSQAIKIATSICARRVLTETTKRYLISALNSASKEYSLSSRATAFKRLRSAFSNRWRGEGFEGTQAKVERFRKMLAGEHQEISFTLESKYKEIIKPTRNKTISEILQTIYDPERILDLESIVSLEKTIKKINSIHSSVPSTGIEAKTIIELLKNEEKYLEETLKNLKQKLKVPSVNQQSLPNLKALLEDFEKFESDESENLEGLSSSQHQRQVKVIERYDEIIEGIEEYAEKRTTLEAHLQELNNRLFYASGDDQVKIKAALRNGLILQEKLVVHQRVLDNLLHKAHVQFGSTLMMNSIQDTFERQLPGILNPAIIEESINQQKEYSRYKLRQLIESKIEALSKEVGNINKLKRLSEEFYILLAAFAQKSDTTRNKDDYLFLHEKISLLKTNIRRISDLENERMHLPNARLTAELAQKGKPFASDLLSKLLPTLKKCEAAGENSYVIDSEAQKNVTLKIAERDKRVVLSFNPPLSVRIDGVEKKLKKVWAGGASEISYILNDQQVINKQEEFALFCDRIERTQLPPLTAAQPQATESVAAAKNKLQTENQNKVAPFREFYSAKKRKQEIMDEIARLNNDQEEDEIICEMLDTISCRETLFMEQTPTLEPQPLIYTYPQSLSANSEHPQTETVPIPHDIAHRFDAYTYFFETKKVKEASTKTTAENTRANIQKFCEILHQRIIAKTKGKAELENLNAEMPLILSKVFEFACLDGLGFKINQRDVEALKIPPDHPLFEKFEFAVRPDQHFTYIHLDIDDDFNLRLSFSTKNQVIVQKKNEEGQVTDVAETALNFNSTALVMINLKELNKLEDKPLPIKFIRTPIYKKPVARKKKVDEKKSPPSAA